MASVTRPPFTRRGFVLPFVILALSVAAILSLAFADEALRGTRAVRIAMAGADAGAQADAGFAAALETWPQDSLWTDAPGPPVRSTRSVAGGPITVVWQRHQPLVATLRITRTPVALRPREAVRRDHLRAVWLAPPRIPVPGALTTNGVVRGGEGTLISGSDVAVAGAPCGDGRDTASVPAVVAAGVAAQSAGAWPGSPAAIAPPSTLVHDLRTALHLVEERAAPVAWDSTPRPLPVAHGWHALRLRTTHAMITGPARWQGLLVVHGDLTLSGDADLEGLLIVEGRLDAEAANLTVQGGVLVADTSAKGVMLGTRSRLFYDRCAVQMALATVARPRFAPFSLWESLPH